MRLSVLVEILYAYGGLEPVVPKEDESSGFRAPALLAISGSSENTDLDQSWFSH